LERTTLLPRRQLGTSNLFVSPVALGLWPIAGITSIGVTDQQSIATIRRAIECGIDHFDTAYSYGFDGQSDRLLRAAVGGDYSTITVASKVGMYYDASRSRKLDSSPTTLRKHCYEIIERLGIDCLDLLYLHCSDGKTSIEESATCLAELQRAGLAKHIGVSNIDTEQLAVFRQVIEPIAIQLPLNMLQQETYREMQPHLSGMSYVAYWPLMKGLLAGRMQRDHVLADDDRRRTYDVYQGAAWHQAQDLLDTLRRISLESGWSIARLVIAWTMAQPGVGSVLCGAKTPDQIAETAAAMDEPLPKSILEQLPSS
jgi:aryl-alcohol dehydrogenase-like predicted oxidoreductase